MRLILSVLVILLVVGGVVAYRSGRLANPAKSVYELAGISVTRNAGNENALIDAAVAKAAPALRDGNWTNSAPLTLEQLKGKVVLVEFWTFDCYNCRNTLPAIKALHQKYQDKGLTVIGVHTPELDQERQWPNVLSQVKELGIAYPVVTDNDYATWNAYGVEGWPTVFILDKEGRVRFRHSGEGAYGLEEQVIQALLAEK
jgi:thiol-disulfide isomerase/thioredoxin